MHYSVLKLNSFFELRILCWPVGGEKKKTQLIQGQFGKKINIFAPKDHLNGFIHSSARIDLDCVATNKGEK